MARISVPVLLLLCGVTFAAPPPQPCPCGEPCEEPVSGICQSDGVTCAVNILLPNCSDVSGAPPAAQPPPPPLSAAQLRARFDELQAIAWDLTVEAKQLKEVAGNKTAQLEASVKTATDAVKAAEEADRAAAGNPSERAHDMAAEAAQNAKDAVEAVRGALTQAEVHAKAADEAAAAADAATEAAAAAAALAAAAAAAEEEGPAEEEPEAMVPGRATRITWRRSEVGVGIGVVVGVGMGAGAALACGLGLGRRRSK